jgi:hypothetical protein
MNKIILNGITYIQESLCEELPIRIVVLQRGWVAIGRFIREDNNCTLHDAYIIRKWGTSAGLGQLAKNGKQSETVLDPAGIIRFYLTVCLEIECDYQKWNSEL